MQNSIPRQTDEEKKERITNKNTRKHTAQWDYSNRKQDENVMLRI